MYCKHGKWMYFDLDKERKNNKTETKKKQKNEILLSINNDNEYGQRLLYIYIDKYYAMWTNLIYLAEREIISLFLQKILYEVRFIRIKKAQLPQIQPSLSKY
jgi:hypothetical protein